MTARPAPSVSTLVITRNHAPFIDQALASLDRQTADDFEIIVIDDCSTDGTTERVRRWIDGTSRDVRLIVNPQSRTMCENRNQFLRACRGAFVTSLSGDDYYEPDRISRQLAFFRSLPEMVGAIFGQSRVVTEAGREVGVWFDSWSHVPEGRIFGELIGGNFLSATTVMLRRSAIDAVGGYDEGLFYEDYDMFLRIAERYEIRYLPGIVSNYRLSAQGASRASEYIASMSESTARLLLKWHGRGLPYDSLIERRARFYAWRAFGADAATGRAALRAIQDAHPSLVNRAASAVASVAGVHAVASRMQNVVRSYKRRHRERAAGRGDLHFP